jgi:hypothetical protein
VTQASITAAGARSIVTSSLCYGEPERAIRSGTMHRSRSLLSATILVGSLLLGTAGGALSQSPSSSPDPSATMSSAWVTPPTEPDVPRPDWGLEDIPSGLESYSPFTVYLIMQCMTNAEDGPDGEDWTVAYYSDLDYCLAAVPLLDPDGGLTWTAGSDALAKADLRDLPLKKWDSKVSWRWVKKDELSCPAWVSGCWGVVIKARKACPKGVTVKLTVTDKKKREIDILRASREKLAKGEQDVLFLSTRKPAAHMGWVDSIVCRS